MQLNKTSVINLIVVLCWLHTAASNLECGRIKNQQLYREKINPELDEFGWLGRMYIIEPKTNKQKHFCNAILISKAHLIAPAHCCIIANELSYPQFVLLGAADPTLTHVLFSSNYTIQDVAVHPNYDRAKRINDIAIIHLDRDVDFNSIIHPICLPPENTFGGVATQYLPVVGHLNNAENLMHVKHGIIVPFDDCRKELQFLDASTDSTICGLLIDENDFSSGSALLGIQLLNLKPRNYYLIAIASFSTIHSKEQYIIFTRISSYINWINHNIHTSMRNLNAHLNKRLIFS